RGGDLILSQMGRKYIQCLPILADGPTRELHASAGEMILNFLIGKRISLVFIFDQIPELFFDGSIGDRSSAGAVDYVGTIGLKTCGEKEFHGHEPMRRLNKFIVNRAGDRRLIAIDRRG